MTNGQNKIFIVKKSFTLADQVVVMEGDKLEYISTDRDKNTDEVDIYFEVVNSFWCEGMEINLTPTQVAEYLVYEVTFD